MYSNELVQEIGDSPNVAPRPSGSFSPTPHSPTPIDAGNWGQRTDIETIRKTHVPNRGPDTWRPLPHDTYVTMIEEAFSNHGFTVSEPLHYRAKSTQNEKILDQGEYGRFLSLYGLAHAGLPELDGITWEAGFVNSYDMSKSAQGGLGRRVMVCSNGMFMGTVEHTFRRKHTKGIDALRDGLFQHIHELVNTSVGSLVDNAVSEAHRIEQWQNTGCNDSDARWIIMEAAKKNVIGAAATMKVLEHWETPEHPEFTDRNVWSLENAFTSNDRGRNLMTQPDRFARLDTIIDSRFGFDNEVKEESVAANW